MNDSAVVVYLTRARQMANAMRLIRGDQEYLAAAALLAVHSAVAFNDAVLMKLTGKASHKDDHRRAAVMTQTACSERRLDDKGIEHFKDLIGVKNEIAYGSNFVSATKILTLCTKAERFETWAERTLREKR